MVLHVHNYNAAGAHVSSGVDDPEDEGAPPSVPGMKVHQFNQEGERIASREELEAAAEVKAPKPKKTIGRPPRAAENFVSDRRRCLELAVASGETAPDEILAVAQKFLAFLEG